MMHKNYLVLDEQYDPVYAGHQYRLFVPDIAVARAKRTIFEQVIDRVVHTIAKLYIKKHEADILAEIDPKVIAKLTQVKLAKNVWDSHV